MIRDALERVSTAESFPWWSVGAAQTDEAAFSAELLQSWAERAPASWLFIVSCPSSHVSVGNYVCDT